MNKDRPPSLGETNIYFGSPLKRWMAPELVKPTNKVCDPYINKAKTLTKIAIKERNKLYKRDLKDFGMSHHSSTLIREPKLEELRKMIIEQSCRFIEDTGFNIDNHRVFFRDLWVQEFATKGGHHIPHLHPNTHVGGFFFLKCSDNTSMPVFYDPRPGALMNRLPERNFNNIDPASYAFHFKPAVGQFIMFPSYLSHGFTVDNGIDPFRFIHWNIEFVPKHD